MRFQNSRIDISEWVIHFVHDRNPDIEANLPIKPPVEFDENGQPVYSEEFQIEEYLDPHGLEPDAHAFSVLKRILFDGYIKYGWSFRQKQATIYGNRSAVCFTEMPLYALLEYAKHRNKPELVRIYGIALLKQELFEVGGRPVIYGLSTKHKEAGKGDPYFKKGFRCLASSCGLGLDEQYRYVATKLNREKNIDWTHEREWRWARINNNFALPGLPIWRKNDEIYFSQIIVIVERSEEAKDFVDLLKSYYDSRYNDYGSEYNLDALINTKVLAIGDIFNKNFARLDDLPFYEISKIQFKTTSTAVIQKVEEAIQIARKTAEEALTRYEETAPKDEQVYILDICGFANVVTYDGHSEITQAFLQLEYAESLGDLGYFIYAVTSGFKTNCVLGAEEAVAHAAAKKLTELLGQNFYVYSQRD